MKTPGPESALGRVPRSGKIKNKNKINRMTENFSLQNLTLERITSDSPIPTTVHVLMTGGYGGDSEDTGIIDAEST